MLLVNWCGILCLVVFVADDAGGVFSGYFTRVGLRLLLFALTLFVLVMIALCG